MANGVDCRSNHPESHSTRQLRRTTQCAIASVQKCRRRSLSARVYLSHLDKCFNALRTRQIRVRRYIVPLCSHDRTTTGNGRTGAGFRYATSFYGRHRVFMRHPNDQRNGVKICGEKLDSNLNSTKYAEATHKPPSCRQPRINHQ